MQQYIHQLNQVVNADARLKTCLAQRAEKAMLPHSRAPLLKPALWHSDMQTASASGLSTVVTHCLMLHCQDGVDVLRCLRALTQLNSHQAVSNTDSTSRQNLTM